MSIPTGSNGKRTGAPYWVIVQGAALTATAFLASSGMSFMCVMRNFDQLYGNNLNIAQTMPAPVYAGFFAAMLIWLFLAGRFAWGNRSWLGMSFSAAAFIVFAFTATGVIRYAYPVCNAF